MRKISKKSQYILKLPLRGRGSLGDIITVKPGYGRYLERYNIAQRASEDILKDLELKKIEWQAKEKENIILADKVLEQLKGIKRVTLKRKVSQEDSLFSFIHKNEIVEFFNDLNIKIELKSIIMNNNIKKLGEYPLVINIYGNKDFETILEIVSNNPLKEIADYTKG